MNEPSEPATTWDSDPPPEPWSMLPDEGPEAFEAFNAYKDLGSGRSIDAVGQKLRKSGSLLSRWSAEHRWVERTRAWDAFLQRIKDREAAAHAALWERRKQEALETAWGDTMRLRAKAARMLRWPLKEVVRKGDNGPTIVKPSKWSLRDAALLVKTAIEGQIAILQAAAVDLGEMADGEVEAIAITVVEGDDEGDGPTPAIPRRQGAEASAGRVDQPLPG